jgi:hypothetical protein
VFEKLTHCGNKFQGERATILGYELRQPQDINTQKYSNSQHPEKFKSMGGNVPG